MVGAYCEIWSAYGDEFTSLGRTTYVEHAVDAAQLNERQDEHREPCLRSVFPLEDQAQALQYADLLFRVGVIRGAQDVLLRLRGFKVQLLELLHRPTSLSM